MGGDSSVSRNSRLSAAGMAFLFSSRGSNDILTGFVSWSELLPAFHVLEQAFLYGLPGYSESYPMSSQ